MFGPAKTSAGDDPLNGVHAQRSPGTPSLDTICFACAIAPRFKATATLTIHVAILYQKNSCPRKKKERGMPA
jgi:hypothetical protein